MSGVNVMHRARAVALAAALLAILPLGAARPEVLPARGLVDSRIRFVAYDGSQVYRLHGFVGYEIDLQFETGETFSGLGAGDLEGVAFVPQDNHLFIKPKAPQVHTNLTVLTNRRSYQFDYSVSARHPDAADADVIYSLRFSYARPTDTGAETAAVRDGLGPLLDRPGASRDQNVDYWYCGSESIKPIAASDDGVHTRLRFGARTEQPAIFAMNG